MDDLQSEDFPYFREMLNQQLDELLARAERTVDLLVQSGELAADYLDRATIDNDRNYTLRIRDRESHLIRKILAALDKIEDGSFGICEECGQTIAKARLMARPVADFCIECKIKKESFEKLAGL
jgi:DnaK suppressor protein